MQSLVEHARTFTEHVAANAKHFERLADGQTPKHSSSRARIRVSSPH